MSFINLNKKLNNNRADLLATKRGNKSISVKRVVVLLIIIFITLALPGFIIFGATKQVVGSGRMLALGVQQNNLDEIKKELENMDRSIAYLNGSLNWLFWMRAIPFVGGYYADAKHFTKAASYELKAAKTALEILEPCKIELGLVGQPTPGQDQIAQGIKILNKILPNIDNIGPYLQKAKAEVGGIDVGKYPGKLGSKDVRKNIELAKNFIVGVALAANEHKDALEITPAVFGDQSPKTYLLLFQNDKELRPTGGFITAYAFLKLDHGHISTTISDDIYRLDEKLLITCKSKICPLTPPAPIVKYLPEVDGKPRSAWSMRDSNISPDLPISAQEFKRMYELLGEGFPFDGIITIDTQVVEELIKITGPVDVYGTLYSADHDKRCNCPNVIYELEHYAEIASRGEMDRKAILGTLMQQILIKSLNSGFGKLPDFINTGVKLASDKHMMFYMMDQKTQDALSRLNWTGQIKSFGGDYLHINDSNFAGGKSNLYVEEKVTLDIKVDKDGSVKNKLTIDYKNPQPYNTWLNGILRDYVRIYVPKGAKFLSSKGSDDPVNTLEDESLGKTYFEAFITIRPQNSRTLSFEYTLPSQVQTKNYQLLIQKQPGAKDHHYTAKINGSTKAEFDLTSDKVFNFSF